MFFHSFAAAPLLTPDSELTAAERDALSQLGFEDVPIAIQRLQTLCADDEQRTLCALFLPTLFYALAEAATPDGSLLNFQRYVQCVPDRVRLFKELSEHPRAVEILVKLFVGSQFLTEILLRNPQYLDELTQHKRLAEFKSREDFVEQGRKEIEDKTDITDVMAQLRRFHQWELLRIAACDRFGLMDLKTGTLQLALLADSLIQVSLEWIARQEGVPQDKFTVLAFGKLGGEELNYSSDIDLVFVCESEAEKYWELGQKLIRILDEATPLGFLYRVDMRLRPWGNAGALVNTADAYVDYIQKHGQLWEKQALLKARPVAGNRVLGSKVLARLEPFVFDVVPAAVKSSVREMKQKIEAQLQRRGRGWGDVKSGPGGIRDIEFVTQFLQITHGKNLPAIRSRNTLDGLIRLSENELIFPEEYRWLTGGYLFLRTVEHALQLMHNQQEHQLPKAERGLAYLARRLDFPDAETFVRQYEQHSRSVREIYERYLVKDEHPFWRTIDQPQSPSSQFGLAVKRYHEHFSLAATQDHEQMLQELGPQQRVRVRAAALDGNRLRITVVGIDRIGELSAICGLMFAYGFDISSGIVFTGSEVGHSNPVVSRVESTPLEAELLAKSQRRFVNEFEIRTTATPAPGAAESALWSRFEKELNELLLENEKAGLRQAQGRLARRVAQTIEGNTPGKMTLLPVEIDVGCDLESSATVLHIRSKDVPGFLYELTNAIAVSGLSIQRMTIETVGDRVVDTLYVVDERHQALPSGGRLNQLRAAIVLITHFTHLLPHSPNPESALLHFRDFLENLFQQPDWLEQLSPLQDSKVLSALATLLGKSDFLWDDFLRLQHQNLFPVVTNVEGLQQAKGRESLERELQELLSVRQSFDARVVALNAFKDREMMRTDMRHILGLQDQFGKFGLELTDVAEVVVAAASQHCVEELCSVHGRPLLQDGGPARFSVCGLGKFGGRELGYASDIELMFLYEGEGETAGPQRISNSDFYQRFVQKFRQMIQSRRQGIFEIDLRLRPYGNAGSLAVSLQSFETYFGATGAAWPYERQALVKLRPVAGSVELGADVVSLRDAMIYRGEPFDSGAMRAMREKQIRQLVQAGTFNAKLSPGGLVDCEYLVQGLQITFGHLDPAIREPNTREAMKALQRYGILTGEARVRLRDAYRFWRRIIDALRVVRGDASDLTIPPVDSDEFVFLARRMEKQFSVNQLRMSLERYPRYVIEVASSLPALMQRRPSST